MNIRIINATGMGTSDPARSAAELLVYTKSTRLEQGEDTQREVSALSPVAMKEQLDYIANTVRSSWEFVDYTFEITGVTRAFTHQLVRTRHGSYAQQTQRGIDMTEFDTLKPELIKDQDENLVSIKSPWDLAMETISRAYSYYKGKGVPAQDCRGLLPTNIHTNIIAKFNLRTLADLVGKRDNPRAQGEYIEFIREVVRLVLEIHPWTQIFLRPDRLATPALDDLMTTMLGDDSPVDRKELAAAFKEIDKLKAAWG